MRKTKIICTMGPANDDYETLKKLMLAGMNGARFNFSHSTRELHKIKFDLVVKAREELDLPIATILDTKGPEIRIGSFKDSKIELFENDIFTLTTKEVEGTNEIVSISYKDLPKDIEVGRPILIDDGLIGMTVISKTDTDIVCKVLNDGKLSNNKGINVPGTFLTMPYVSMKDREDISFGIQTGFDFIAASFVRSKDDILEIRKILDEHNCHTVNIIAKIENAGGVDNIDEIISVADGIMVARGDMGVEIPLEDVPVLQKLIIQKAYNAGKQVITATQMLDSMIKNPRPTRAEATDVANAIYDGTSAIMLSGETAVGEYPIESLETMVKIAKRAEEEIDYKKNFMQRDYGTNLDVTDAISHATCSTAHDLGAGAIITVTKSGVTARMISKFRPYCPIIGCTVSQHVRRQLNLSWGVYPMVLNEMNSTDELFDYAVNESQKTGIVSNGDLVVITAGVPLTISGTTNLMKVHVVGHVLVSGNGITKKTACAGICVCKSEEAALKNFKKGQVLVIPQTSNALMPILRDAVGIITEKDGLNSHAAIAGLAMDIPVIVGAENATEILKNGCVVYIDAEKGRVSAGEDMV